MFFHSHPPRVSGTSSPGVTYLWHISCCLEHHSGAEGLLEDSSLRGCSPRRAACWGPPIGQHVLMNTASLLRRILLQSDLHGQDLASHDFEGADMSEARLCHCDFSAANMTRTQLAGADLSHAHIWSAALQVSALLLRVAHCVRTRVRAPEPSPVFVLDSPSPSSQCLLASCFFPHCVQWRSEMHPGPKTPTPACPRLGAQVQPALPPDLTSTNKQVTHRRHGTGHR